VAAGQADLERPGLSLPSLDLGQSISRPGHRKWVIAPKQGKSMATQLELSSRAALCRRLAQREPKSRVYWLAEAANWSRLSRETIHLERTGRKDDPFEQFLALIAKQPRP
jgi:hypothetical protein